MARPTTTGMHEVRVPVAGMTCRACETRVGKALARVPGVESAVVSVRRGEASLIVADDLDRTSLDRSVQAAVAGAGYRVGREPWVSPDVTVWREALVAIAVVSVGAVVVGFFGLARPARRVGLDLVGEPARRPARRAGSRCVDLHGAGRRSRARGVGVARGRRRLRGRQAAAGIAAPAPGLPGRPDRGLRPPRCRPRGDRRADRPAREGAGGADAGRGARHGRARHPAAAGARRVSRPGRRRCRSRSPARSASSSVPPGRTPTPGPRRWARSRSSCPAASRRPCSSTR